MSMTTLRRHASAAVGEVGGRLRSHHRRGRRGSGRLPRPAPPLLAGVPSGPGEHPRHRGRRTRHTTADGRVDPVGLSRWVVSPGEAEHGPACPGRCPWPEPGVLRAGHGQWHPVGRDAPVQEVREHGGRADLQDPGWRSAGSASGGEPVRSVAVPAAQRDGRGHGLAPLVEVRCRRNGWARARRHPVRKLRCG
jgi:hypothetical protein